MSNVVVVPMIQDVNGLQRLTPEGLAQFTGADKDNVIAAAEKNAQNGFVTLVLLGEGASPAPKFVTTAIASEIAELASSEYGTYGYVPTATVPQTLHEAERIARSSGVIPWVIGTAVVGLAAWYFYSKRGSGR